MLLTKKWARWKSGDCWGVSYEKEQKQQPRLTIFIDEARQGGCMSQGGGRENGEQMSEIALPLDRIQAVSSLGVDSIQIDPQDSNKGKKLVSIESVTTVAIETKAPDLSKGREIVRCVEPLKLNLQTKTVGAT